MIEPLLLLLGLVVLAIPVVVILLLVGVAGLRSRVASLEADVARLMVEQRDAKRGVVPAKPASSPEPAQAAARPVPEVTETPETQSAPPAQSAAARAEARRKAAAAVAAAEPTGPTLFDRALTWVATNWFYVVSALSLALAGLFLVQYGVENGLFPPSARVLAALAFGAALIGAGEVIRRRYGDGPDSATAYLPSVFSGAGLVTLFGGIAAARLLYGLIGVEVAFAGMVAVGLLGVVLGWMHGPLLTTVGVLGAFVAPMFVGSNVPATNWLFVYFAVVTAVGLGVDTVRRWAWVSALSVGAGFVMGALTLFGGGSDLHVGFQAYVVVLAVLAVLVPARSIWPDHDGVVMTRWAVFPRGPRPSFPTMLAAAAVAAAVVALVWATELGGDTFWVAVVACTVMALALIVWSVSGPALQDLAAVPVVGLLVAVALEGEGRGSVWRGFADAYAETPEANFPLAVTLLWAVGMVLSIAAAERGLRRGYGVPWALGAAVTAPLMAIVLEVTWAPARVIGAYPWALHGIALAALMVAYALRFARVDQEDRTRASLFVVSALAAISFAMVLILSSAALTVALAVTVLVAALLDRRFDLPLMQVVVVVGVVAVGTRLIADPGLGWAVDAPVWEVLLAYGGALAAFVASLWALRGRTRLSAQVMLDTAAWSTGGTLASLLLFRFLQGLTGADHTGSHWAMGLFATIWFGLMVAQLIRLEKLGGWLSFVRAGLGAVFGLIGLGALTLGLTILSPLLSSWGTDVAGPPLLNTLLVAYLLPALVLGLGTWQLRLVWLRLGLAGIAVALAAFWAFAALRHLWQGADGMELRHGFLQGELYSYTVALLVVGALLFYQSLARNAPVLRRAGLVVIGLAVAKVFLIDISGLEGLTRVLSLVVLGLSLAALAWLNRWAQTRTASGPTQENPAPPDPPSSG